MTPATASLLAVAPVHRRRARPAAVVLLVLLAGMALLASPWGWRLVAAALTTGAGGTLVLSGAHGSLAGEFGVQRLRVTGEDGLVVDAESVIVRWQPSALWQGQIVIDRLHADRLQIAPGRGDGSPAAAPTSLTPPVTLAIRSLTVDALRLAGSTPVAVDALDAALAAGPDGHTLQLRQGRLGVGEVVAALRGEASLAAATPFRLTLELQADGEVAATPFSANLRCGASLLAPACRFGVSSGVGAGSGEAALLPFAAWPLAAASVQLSDLDPARWLSELPTARISVRVDLQPATGGANAGQRQPLKGNFQLANAVPGAWSQGRWPVAMLAGDFAVDGETLVLAPLQLALAGGGRVTGDVTVRRSPGDTGGMSLPAVSAQLAVTDVDLAALHAAAPKTRLHGRLVAEPVARPNPDVGGISGDGDHPADAVPAWQLRVQLADARRRAVGLDVDAEVSPRAVDIRRGTLRALGAISSLRGRVAFDGSQPLDLAGQLEGVDPAAFGSLPPGEIDVGWSLQGTLAPTPALQVKVLSGERAQWLGQPLRIDFDAAWAGEHLQVSRGEVDVGGNQLRLDGRLGAADARLTWRFDAAHLDRLSPALLPWTGARLAGALRGDGVFSGTLADPAGSLHLQGDELRYGAWRLATLQVAGQRVAGADGTFSVDATLLTQSDGRERTTLTRARNLSLRASGTPARHRASLDLRADAGRVQLALSGARTGSGGWQGQLDELTLSGTAAGSGDGALQAPASLSLAPRAGDVDFAVRALRWRGAPGELTLDELSRDGDRWRSRGQLRGLAAARLFDLVSASPATRAAAGDLRLRADWDLRADAGGAPGSDPALGGQLTLARQDGDGRLPGGSPGTPPLGLETLSLQLQLAGLRAQLALQAGGPALGEAHAEFDLGIGRTATGWGLMPQAPVRGSVRVSVPDLAWLGGLSGSTLALAGRLDANATLTGTAAAPQWRGQLGGEGLGVVWRDEGIQLRDGSLRADFDETALRVRQLRLFGAPGKPPKSLPLPPWVRAGGGGEATVSGEIAWADQRGQFDFRAERFAVLQRPDLWLVASGSGRAVLGESPSIEARGQFRVDAAAIQIAATAPPRLGDDVRIVGATPAPAAGVPVDAVFDVDFGEAFHFSGRGLAGRIGGRLQLSQRARDTEPRAVGTLALQDGRFDAYGQTLDVERGIVNFQGALDNPGLNVLALRRGLPVTAGVRVAGTVRAPRVSLYSDPPLSEPEKLSWLVLGRGSDATTGADASTLLAAAQALLQGDGRGPVGQIASALGLDQVTIGNRQAAGGLVGGSRVAPTGSGGSATPADQVLVVSKRLSATTSVAFEQTLSGVGAVLKLTQQLSRSLSVTARTGVENALSVQWSKRFR